MGLFSFGSKTLAQAEFFSGYVDYHSHILPGVDDGLKTVEESLSALELFEKQGVRTVWLTPHIMEDIPNSTADLKRKFEELATAYNGPIILKLASENMLDSLFLDRLNANDFLPMEDKRLLVETSYFNPPYDMDNIISSIQSKGYYPLLAHPERYMYMREKDYEKLRNNGVLMQMNIPSLCGGYGEDVKEKAVWLLKNGYYSVSGTDLHRVASFENLLCSGVAKKYLDLIPR